MRGLVLGIEPEIDKVLLVGKALLQILPASTRENCFVHVKRLFDHAVLYFLDHTGLSQCIRIQGGLKYPPLKQLRLRLLHLLAQERRHVHIILIVLDYPALAHKNLRF
jgi:hypothetical protein